MSDNEVKTSNKKIVKKSFSDEFNSFFNKNVQPKLEPIEAKRKQYQIISYVIPTVLVLLAILFVVLNFSNSIAITAFIVAGILSFMSIQIVKKLYSSKVKGEVLPIILSFIGHFKINDSEETLNKYVDGLHLFDNFNMYIYDDRLKGNYKNLDIEIEEISLEYENIRNPKYSYYNQNVGSVAVSAKFSLFYKLAKTILKCIENQSATISMQNKIFSGLFIRVPSLKKYNGRTVVKAEKSSHHIKEETKVNLEDPEFERLYDTYSTDQVEARYLLTTAFMNRMVSLSKKGIGKGILVSFEQGYINIAVSMDKDWLEIPLSTSVTDINNYKSMISELYSILKIIDSLKLDQNIGL